MPLWTVEEQKGGAWVIRSVCKDNDDAVKTLAAMLACRPDWPARVQEYARVERVTFRIEAFIRGEWHTLGRDTNRPTADVVVRNTLASGSRVRVTTVNLGDVQTFEPTPESAAKAAAQEVD